MILAQTQKAKSILEVGTLAGYSTIWLARGLPPDGRLITLESDERHAKMARSNLAKAGFSKITEVILGPAYHTLPQLSKDGRGPFDLIFIDADKPNNAEYFDWAVKLSHKGSLIIVDNVVRDGQVLDAASTDPFVQGVRRFNDLLAAEKRVSATAIQTVGSKGYDGFAIATVIADP
jgi:predicted O-methyltransferase YrrM